MLTFNNSLLFKQCKVAEELHILNSLQCYISKVILEWANQENLKISVQNMKTVK